MNKIEPAYVTFEQAKWLKDKGFDTNVKSYYTTSEEFTPKDYYYFGNEINYNSPINDVNTINGTISRPEQWQVVEFLRINHGIWVYTKPVLDGDGEWIFKSYIKLMNDFKAKEYQTKLCREPQEAYSAAFDYIKENNLI
jgi:hypothetical protein